MNNDKPLIGFERNVRLDWMSFAANLAAKGIELKEANPLIDSFLKNYISGETSRRKTKNILTATWIKSSEEAKDFKRKGVSLFSSGMRSEHIVIHYGMCLATYPFFRSLSSILGRLFKLQNEVLNDEFYRRVSEVIGDRDSVKRAAARYLQTLIDWGILERVGKAKFKLLFRKQLSDKDIATWLYSSILFSSESKRMLVDEIIANPAFFPFVIPYGLFNYLDSDFIEVVHSGVGQVVVGLMKD